MAKTMVSWQAFLSLPPSSRAPRVSLAPKSPFPFPFKRLPRRLVFNITFLQDRREDCRGRSRIFFRRGCTRLLLYFNTNKPQFFFLQNTSCIRKPQVISHPLHPPPRSAPGLPVKSCSTGLFLVISFLATPWENKRKT